MEQANIGTLAGKLYDLLKDLEPDARARVVSATMMLFGEVIPANAPRVDRPSEVNSVSSQPSFVDREDISAKQFMFEKQSHTDIDRVVCLAFYLTHYRDNPHFKTIDISKLNTEAAQIKFSNPAQAVANTTGKGLITSVTKGFRQITSIGEEYVAALPDKSSAKNILSKYRPRKKRGKN